MDCVVRSGLAAAQAAEVINMTQRSNSENPRPAGGVVRAIRRIFGVGIPATMVMSATAAVIFAIALDGCSKHESKSANGSTPTQAMQAEMTQPAALPSPSPVAQAAEVNKKPKTKRRSTVSYADSTYGVSFRYPRKYKLLTPDKPKNDDALARLPMNFAEPGGVSVAAVELPTGPATSFLNLSVNEGLSSEQCQMFAKPEATKDENNLPIQTDDESAVAKVSVKGMEFSKTEDVTDQLEARYYHHFEAGPDKVSGTCYEFALGVAPSPDNNGPVDDVAMFQQLERILRTVKIKPELAQAVTASVPEQPATGTNPQ